MAPNVANALLHNGSVAALFEQAVRRGEGQVTSTGAFAAVTGPHTGRSPADKFIVRDPETEAAVWWDNSKALTPEQFGTLHRDFLAHAADRNLFVQDLFARAPRRSHPHLPAHSHRRLPSPALRRPRLLRIRLPRAVHPASSDRPR